MAPTVGPALLWQPSNSPSPQVRCSTSEQGLDGVCGKDGLCYASGLDINAQINEWESIYHVFVTHSSIDNLQALNEFSDINSTVALAKAAVAKISLEHQLVLLDSASGYRRVQDSTGGSMVASTHTHQHIVHYYNAAELCPPNTRMHVHPDCSNTLKQTAEYAADMLQARRDIKWLPNLLPHTYTAAYTACHSRASTSC